MKDRISIVIHGPGGKEPKIVSIKIKYVKCFSVLVIIFSFLSLVSYLLNAFFVQKYLVLREKEKKLKTLMVINKKYKEELAKLKNNLLNLENYLTERGVIRKRKDALGGLSKLKTEELTDENYLDFLVSHSEELFYQLKITPTGFPVYGRITSTLGWRKNPFGSGYEYHTGIDIKAPYGAPVYATAEGVVIYSGWYSDYGKAVIIKHPSGYKTLYGHLSRIKVKYGEKVKAGQIIGYVGSTGRSTGPHLHYEVRLGSKYLDPMKFIVWK